jgi:hypothetical protein
LNFLSTGGDTLHLLPVKSAVGRTKDCGRHGKSDVVVLHFKAASIIRGCEAEINNAFLHDLSARSRTNLVKTSCLLRVDSASKRNDLADKMKSCFV